MLVAKKILHSALALIVSVGMVLTLTPAMAWGATEGGGTVGADVRATVEKGPDGSLIGHGSTTVVARVYSLLGKFISISAPENYQSVSDAITAITGSYKDGDADKNRVIVAKLRCDEILANGESANVKVTWSVKQIGSYNAETGSYRDQAGSEATILVKDYEIKKADVAASHPDGLVVDLPMDFQGGADKEAVGRLQQTIYSENAVYEVKAALDDGDYITTTVSIISGYKFATLDDKGNIVSDENPWGEFVPSSITSNTNIAGFFRPGATLDAEMLSSESGAADTALDKLNTAALDNKPVEEIETATTLTVRTPANQNKWPAYIMDMTVSLPIDAEKYDKLSGAIDENGDPVAGKEQLKLGDTVNVYWLNPNTGEVEIIPAKVVEGVDSDGDGLKEMAVQVVIAGTGALLGTFAVGYPANETYELTTQVVGPGSISPVLAAQQRSCALPQTIVMNPLLPGYVVSKVTIDVVDKDDKDATLTGDDLKEVTAGHYVIDGPLMGNTVTLDPKTQGILKGYKLVVTAYFEKSTYGESANVTIKAQADPEHTDAQGFVRASYTQPTPEGNTDSVVVRVPGTNVTDPNNTISIKDSTTAIQAKSAAGLLLEFNPVGSDLLWPDGANYQLKSLTIRGKEVAVEGSSYFLSAIPTDEVEIVATFTNGAPPTEGLKCNVEASVQVTGDTTNSKVADPTVSGAGEVPLGGMTTVTVQNNSQGKDQYTLKSVTLYPEGGELSDEKDDEGNPLPKGIVLNVPTDVNEVDLVAKMMLYNIVSDLKVVFNYTYEEIPPLATLYVPATKPDGGTTDPVPGSDPIEIYPDTEAPVTVTVDPDDGYEIDTIKISGTDKDDNPLGPIDLANEANWPVDPGDSTKKLNPFKLVDMSDESKGVTVNFFSDPEKDFGSMKVINKGTDDAPIYEVWVNIFGDVNLDPTFRSTRMDVATITALAATNPDDNDKQNSALSAESMGGSVSPATLKVPFSAATPGTAEFTVLPETGYEVEKIEIVNVAADVVAPTLDTAIDDVNASGAPTFSISGILGDFTVKVTFKAGTNHVDKQTFDITTSAVMHGMISPTSVEVYEGDEPTFNLMPDENYRVGAVVVEYPPAADAPAGTSSTFQSLTFNTLSGDDNGLGNGFVTLPAVTQDAIVHASFVPIDTPTDPSDSDYDTGLRYVEVTYGPDGFGTVVPAGLQLVAIDASNVLTAQPAGDEYSVESTTITPTGKGSLTAGGIAADKSIPYTYSVTATDAPYRDEAGTLVGATAGNPIEVNFKFKKTVTATIPGTKVANENATTVEGGKITVAPAGTVPITPTGEGENVVNTITVPEKGTAGAPATITLTPDEAMTIGDVVIAVNVDDPENPGTQKRIEFNLTSDPDFEGAVVVDADNGTGVVKIAHDPALKDGEVELRDGVVYVGGSFDLDVEFVPVEIPATNAIIKASAEGNGIVSPETTVVPWSESDPGTAGVSVIPDNSQDASNKYVGVGSVTVSNTGEKDITVSVGANTQTVVAGASEVSLEAALINELNASDAPKVIVEDIASNGVIEIHVVFKDGIRNDPVKSTHVVDIKSLPFDEADVVSPLGAVTVYDDGSLDIFVLPSTNSQLLSIWTEKTVDGALQVDKNGKAAMSDPQTFPLTSINADTTVYVEFADTLVTNPDTQLRVINITGTKTDFSEDSAKSGVYKKGDELQIKFSPTADAANYVPVITIDGTTVVSVDKNGHYTGSLASNLVKNSDGSYTFKYKVENDASINVAFEEAPQFIEVTDVTLGSVKVSPEIASNWEVRGDSSNPPTNAEDIVLTISVIGKNTFDSDKPVRYDVGDGQWVILNPAPTETEGVYTVTIPKGVIKGDTKQGDSSVWSSKFKLEINTTPFTTTENTDYKRIDIEVKGAGSGKVTPAAQAGENAYVTYVATGGSQTLNFLPNAGNHVASVLVDGVDYTAQITQDPGTYTYTFSKLDHNAKVIVTFEAGDPTDPMEPVPETVTVNVVLENGGVGGQLLPMVSSVEVVKNGDFSIIAQPTAGYEMSAVLAQTDAANMSVAGNVVSLSNIADSCTLKIAFNEQTTTKYANVTVTAGNHGSVSPSGVLTLIEGSILTVNIEPDTLNGFTLDEIMVTDASGTVVDSKKTTPGVNVPAADLVYTLGNVQDGMKVHVTFRFVEGEEEVPDVTYNDITVKYAGSGTGYAEPDFIHAVKGSANTISLLPVTGSHVTAVSVVRADGQSLSGSEWGSLDDAKELLTINAIADLVVTVTFDKDQAADVEKYHKVRISWSSYDPANGYVANDEGGTVSPSQDLEVPDGGSATIAILNKTGWKPQVALAPDTTVSDANGKLAPIDPALLTFGDIEKDSSYWTKGNYTAFDVRGNMILHVRFVKDPTYTITPGETYIIAGSATTGGSIYPSGDVTVVKNASSTFSFKPDNGYALSYIVIDRDKGDQKQIISAGDVRNMQYTFTHVDTDHTIQAVFARAGEIGNLSTVTIKNTTPQSGSLDPVGTVVKEAGDTLTITYTPGYGFELDEVTVLDRHGNPVPGVKKDNGSITIPNLPAGEVAVSVSFRPVNSENDPDKNVPDYIWLTTVVKTQGGATGKLSYGPGTTHVERLANGASLSISVAPGKDADGNYYIADPIVIEPQIGTSRTIGATAVGTNSETIYTVSEKGYFEVTSQELNGTDQNPNHGVTVTVTFRPMTPEEKADVKDGDLKPLPEDKFASVTLSKKGLGTINPDGERKVAPGTSLMITMTPSKGYELSEFTVNRASMMDKLGVGSAALGNGVQSMMYRLDVPADGGRYNVEATFKHADPATKYTVTAKVDESSKSMGAISPEGESVVPAGGSLPIFMYPHSGCKIAKIVVDRGDGSPVTIENHPSVSYKVSDVRSNVTVTVTFGQLSTGETNPADTVKHIIANISSTGGGQVSPTGELDVPENETINFNIMPDKDKAVQAVVINGKRIPIIPGTPSYPVRFDSSILDERGNCNIEFEFVDADKAVHPGDSADLNNVNVNVNVSVSVDVNTNVTVGSDEYGFAECDASPKSFKAIPKGGSANFYLLPAPGWTIEDVSYTPNDAASSIQVWGGARDLDDPDDADKAIGSIEDQKMHWVDGNPGKWVVDSTTRGTLNVNAARATDVGTSGIRAVSALDKFDFAEDSKGGKFFSVYTASLKEISQDAEVNVTMIPIDVYCDKNGIEKDDITYHKYLTHNVVVDAVGGGTVEPFGNNKVLDGQSMTIRMTPFASYYISSVEVTRNGVKEDVTGQVFNGELTLENITSDMQVLVTFDKVGVARMVNVRLNSAKIEVYDPDTGEIIGEPKLVDLKDVVVGTSQTNSKVNPLSRDGEEYILDAEGKREGYMANSHNTFYFEYTKWDYKDGSALDGLKYVLESVDYAGSPQGISSSNVYPSYTVAKLPVTGGFDVVFRLAKTDAIPDMYKIYPNVEGSGGRISPSAIQDVEPGGSQAFAFFPEDHYMVDEVVVKNRDTDEERTLAASEYTNGGVYSYTFVNVNANWDITVSFCEAVYLTTDWEQTAGFIAPNGKGDGDLRVKKGSQVEFLIAPYSNSDVDYYDVKSATFDENSIELTQRKAVHDEFKQSQVGANRLEGLTKLKTESTKDGVKVGNLTRGVSSSASTATDKTTSELSAMAAAPAEDFGLNMKPLGSTYKTVYSYTTPTLTGGDSTLAVEFERTQLETETFTLTANVEGEGGKVSPTTLQVRKGQSGTFNFIADSGYNVGQIKIDNGQYIPYRSTSYTFTNVQMDQTITVKFARSVGSGSYIDRVSKTVGSMLRTGDLNNVILAGLIGIAALAFLITGLSIVHRNKKRRRMEE